MTPNGTMPILAELAVESPQPSRTYRLDLEAGRVRGSVDGREAVAQAVRKALRTGRFAYLIYSWNYGTEWERLFGKSRQVVESELKRVLWEALERDERITALAGVTVDWDGKRSCTVSVTVETIFGEVREEVAAYV